VALRLADRIPDGSSILVDTNPLVYVLEGSPLAEPFEPVFAAIDAGRIEAVTTAITLAEVVVAPLRAGREALARQYLRLLTRTPGWRFCEIDAEIAMAAARLRARHRLKLPDAIQVAAAVREGCHAILTHDRDFGGITEILVLGPGERRRRR
jgi:predicted nucleic acid-binding protein